MIEAAIWFGLGYITGNVVTIGKAKRFANGILKAMNDQCLEDKDKVEEEKA